MFMINTIQIIINLITFPHNFSYNFIRLFSV
nr:MAG TPA: hypothetical protein [Caudoviricetes sp.]